jgi:hypothetical protein
MAAVCIAGLEFVGSSYSTSVDVHLDSRVAECATRLPQTPGVKSFEIGNTLKSSVEALLAIIDNPLNPFGKQRM